MRKKILIVLCVLLLIALGLFFFYVPGYVGRQMNVTLNPPPYAASERARELHKKLLVTDMHADTLMWNRDLLKKGSWA
jgi:hypothetical protein